MISHFAFIFNIYMFDNFNLTFAVVSEDDLSKSLLEAVLNGKKTVD